VEFFISAILMPLRIEIMQVWVLCINAKMPKLVWYSGKIMVGVSDYG
jgi:hypothetical protein